MNPLSGISTIASAAPTAQAAPSPETLKVARDFEAIFLRTLLGSLEKSTKVGSTSTAGQSAYGSMVVGAMSDSMSQAGGIGLAEVIARAMTRAEAATNTATGESERR